MEKKLKKIRGAQRLLLDLFEECDLEREKREIKASIGALNGYLDEICLNGIYSQDVRMEALELLREGREIYK